MVFEALATSQRGAVAAQPLEHRDGAQREAPVRFEILASASYDVRMCPRQVRGRVRIQKRWNVVHEPRSLSRCVTRRRSADVIPSRLPCATAQIASADGAMSTSSP